jgi:hypothetical protein
MPLFGYESGSCASAYKPGGYFDIFRLPLLAIIAVFGSIVGGGGLYIAHRLLLDLIGYMRDTNAVNYRGAGLLFLLVYLLIFVMTSALIPSVSTYYPIRLGSKLSKCRNPDMAGYTGIASGLVMLMAYHQFFKIWPVNRYSLIEANTVPFYIAAVIILVFSYWFGRSAVGEDPFCEYCDSYMSKRIVGQVRHQNMQTAKTALSRSTYDQRDLAEVFLRGERLEDNNSWVTQLNKVLVRGEKLEDNYSWITAFICEKCFSDGYIELYTKVTITVVESHGKWKKSKTWRHYSSRLNASGIKVLRELILARSAKRPKPQRGGFSW